MLYYFIAVPVAFLVAQGFWTLIAYILTWCGFPGRAPSSSGCH
jgi:hypothetical protein